MQPLAGVASPRTGRLVDGLKVDLGGKEQLPRTPTSVASSTPSSADSLSPAVQENKLSVTVSAHKRAYT
jgi:hypothetical protein